MFEAIKTMLAGRNEFASGGLLLMIIGGVVAYLRVVPEKLWRWLVSQTTMIITVKDDDASFLWVKEWFLEQPFLQRMRRIDLDTTLRNDRIAMIPAPGKHWFWYEGRPFEVWFTRREDTKERSGKRMESFTFRTLGRKRAVLQSLVNDVMKAHRRRRGTQSYLYTWDDGWDYVEGYAPRLLDSVILQAGEQELLLEDIREFRQARSRYQQLGIPYHRGYLLYGPPGTGKTSLVSALAAHFGLSIYMLNLADLDDRSLVTAVNRVPANSILLFEDIDAMRSSRSRQATPGMAPAPASEVVKGVPLSGLLSILDGFFAPTGVLFVMTTNHVERLDGALLRPGRIDHRLYMGLASERQKLELYRRFFPASPAEEALAFVTSAISAETMAEFQGLLLAKRQGRTSLDQPVGEEVMAR